ncbi:MAG: glycosyltransferase family 2 protein [Gemmatimonadota bacterium]
MAPEALSGAQSLSVVVASLVGAPFIDGCLSSLEGQAHELGAEVVVVACGTEAYAERIRREFSWVRVVHRPERESVPRLRRHGVEAARGEIVAVIEEHCVAAPDWLRRAAAAHGARTCAAVGGPVADLGYRRMRDWVVYFCEYNGSLPPAPAGEVAELNGANIAYRREVLLRHKALLDDGYWEASLHPRLLAEGESFVSDPRMVVFHSGPFDLGYYLRQRYWFSRAYAGARAGTLPAWRRMAYLAAAPAVPALLLARMAGRVWRKRCHVDRFVLALPLFVPALAAFVAGEWIGYLAGPGDALSKVE